jgi:hypothetical protein
LESEAEQLLHGLFYGGTGPRHLGWEFAVDRLLPDGTWEKVRKEGWRYWRVPTDPAKRRWWNPVWEHLKGLNRGVVALSAIRLPFVAVDLDRHSATVAAHDHMLRVIRVGRLLKRNFPEISWSLVEVNPRNGSVKLFGFMAGSVPFDQGLELGRRVDEFLVDKKIVCEVFPHNCSQVGLPARSDKLTITPTGLLPTCTRRKKVGGKLVPFQAYSAVALLDAIRSGIAYDEGVLYRILKESCSNLPDRVEHGPAPRAVSKGDRVAIETARLRPPSPQAQGDYSAEPNSFTRQTSALLELARRLRRVPGEAEALAFIKDNGLHTGEWADNLARRRSRVRWIVGHIAKTFDPAPYRPVSNTAQVGRYDAWAQQHVGVLRQRPRRTLDEYGNVHEHRNRTVVGWAFVSDMLTVLQSIFEQPNHDQSVPEPWAEKKWTTLYEQRGVRTPWSSSKWRIARDWLDAQGIIEVFDRKWHFDGGRGQAMKWRPARAFYDLTGWYKTKDHSLQEAIALAEFLKGKPHPPPLNSYVNRCQLLEPVELAAPHSRAPPWAYAVRFAYWTLRQRCLAAGGGSLHAPLPALGSKCFDHPKLDVMGPRVGRQEGENVRPAPADVPPPRGGRADGDCELDAAGPEARPSAARWRPPLRRMPTWAAC